MGQRQSWLTSKLEAAPGAALVAYALATAFATYFCMYAFRKPFAAAKFDGLTFLDTAVALKTAFVISQIIGYTLSKYIGIKVCSEVPAHRRAWFLVVLILLAEASLLLFAVVPSNWKVVPIFFNGLPLGMVWGLVVWYLEGRRTSEVLLAGVSCSYIVSSGAVKDVGRYLMSGQGVSEAWMPFLTGLIFLPPFLVAVWLLNQLPPPTAADIQARVRRAPMDGTRRVAFVQRFLLGLFMLLVVYFFITAFRDFRDNFGVEIFAELGYREEPALFTKMEILVMFGVMGVLSLLSLIRDNRHGLVGAFAVLAVGVLLIGGATLLLDLEKISGFWWMCLIGLGSYLVFVPFGSVLFDRLIAYTGVPGTAVFTIYLADAIGYTGSVGLQLFKDLAHTDMSRLAFFRGFSYFTSILGLVLLTASCLFFTRKSWQRPAAEPDSIN